MPTNKRERIKKALPRTYRLVQARDKGICRYCGFPGECLDHILPYWYTRDDSVENLVVACMKCNDIARDIVFPSFEAKKDYVLAIRREQIMDDLPPDSASL